MLSSLVGTPLPKPPAQENKAKKHPWPGAQVAWQVPSSSRPRRLCQVRSDGSNPNPGEAASVHLNHTPRTSGPLLKNE